jgi:polysaccharide export outer membrane protein
MKTFIYLLLLLLFASCKTQNLFVQEKKDRIYQHLAPDSAFAFDEKYEYRISKDDKISISFWGHDDLSVGSLYGIYNSNEVYGKWLLVDVRGNITLPRLGNFRIEGLSVAQAEDSLTHLYKKWVVNPVIDVKVLNKEITIIGELRNPGKYVVERDNNSLLDLVAQAGGYEFYANLKCIKVIRQYGQTVKMINLDLTGSGDYRSRNIQLHPGDLVVVPSKKNKEFDKRIATIIPLATSVSAAAISIGTFL